MANIKFVGEIGCNHLGNMYLAKQHLDIFSQFSKANYLKFQKRTIDSLLSLEEQQQPHPNSDYAHGSTYGEHRRNLEFSIDQHIELYDYCQKLGVNYACSAWDLQAAKELINALPNMEYIKIPSASNLNFEMLKFIYLNSRCDIHLSLGMTTSLEIKQIIDFIRSLNCASRTVLYACTSGYPVSFKDLALLEIRNLIKESDFQAIGFSGHHLGIAMDIAAATLGATWIERHVVTCRSSIRHTDAPASLEPDGVRRLIRDLKNLEESLTYKNDILPIELIQRQKLKRIA